MLKKLTVAFCSFLLVGTMLIYGPQPAFAAYERLTPGYLNNCKYMYRLDGIVNSSFSGNSSYYFNFSNEVTLVAAGIAGHDNGYNNDIHIEYLVPWDPGQWGVINSVPPDRGQVNSTRMDIASDGGWASGCSTSEPPYDNHDCKSRPQTVDTYNTTNGINLSRIRMRHYRGEVNHITRVDYLLLAFKNHCSPNCPNCNCFSPGANAPNPIWFEGRGNLGAPTYLATSGLIERDINLADANVREEIVDGVREVHIDLPDAGNVMCGAVGFPGMAAASEMQNVDNSGSEETEAILALQETGDVLEERGLNNSELLRVYLSALLIPGVVATATLLIRKKIGL